MEEVNNLLDIMNKSKKYNEYINKIKEEKGSVMLTGLTRVAKAQICLATYGEFRKEDKKTQLLYVVSDESEIAKARENLEFLSDKKGVQILEFREKEMKSFEVITESQENYLERMKVFQNLINEKETIIITTIAALMQNITPIDVLRTRMISFKVDEEIDIKEVSENLAKLGYVREEIAERKGEMSLRGGILDIGLYEEQGIRVELWGDTVSSIRKYQYSDQKSILSEDKVEIVPVTEMLLEEGPDETISKIYKKISPHLNTSKLLEEFENDKENFEQGNIKTFIEKYIKYIYQKKTYFMDYLKYVNSERSNNVLVFFDDTTRILKKSKELEKNVQILSTQLESNNKIKNTAFDTMIGYEEIIRMIDQEKIPTIYLEEKDIKFFDKSTLRAKQNGYSFNYKEVNFFRSELDRLSEKIKEQIAKGKKVYIVAKETYNWVKSKIAEEFNTKEVILLKGKLSQGFDLPELKIHVIAIDNKADIKRDGRFGAKKNVKDIIFADLAEGDYIVHNINGIGKFIEIKAMEVQGVTKDYIKLEYRGGDLLYIPTDDLSNVKKYIGADISDLKLSKIGSKDWAKTKARVKNTLREVAEELVTLYKQREKIKGYSFSIDTKDQERFEMLFPYVETNDQLRCSKEIKQDMEKEKPMDRLLCGDVGFGKTEVAMRAAFKAVDNFKQVAYIVPTTVLARQQTISFKTRMEEFGIVVEELSRFKTKKQTEKILSDLKKGKIDILVGTHRLLSDDVQFFDLGLLIIDEEHRFGVKAKEKIKLYKNTVDVLTMTATPIPRTMNMSLSGVRDMSVIYDPPHNRLPVKTYVVEEDEKIIKEAVDREMSRNGQVYYIHNTVEKIQARANRLSKMFPDLNIDYAHGKMSGKEIEEKMENFAEGKIDILVCTTILESGIDIANANTVIIEDSDKLGLAQLYQIRGRVGRGVRQAYAYITTKKNKILSEKSEKRIKALKEFTELGSGFKIAVRDLEIRGAGSLFGDIQHGHMGSVGYDTYFKLLEENVKELQGINQTDEKQTTVDLVVDAYIPDKFVKNQKYKMDIYKEIIASSDNKQLRETMKNLTDRYGKFPKELNNFLKLIIIRNMASERGIKKIIEMKSEYIKNKVQIHFTKKFNLDNMDILINRYRTKVEFQNSKEEDVEGIIVFKIKDEERKIEEVHQIINEMLKSNH